MANTAVALIGNLLGGLSTMPKRPPPDYLALEREAWRENTTEVSNRLSSNERNLLKRISLYIWRFGYEQDAVHKKIHDDEMFAAHFAVEPRRQGFHERIAANWLEEEESVKNFTVLNKQGRDALYVNSDGEIVSGLAHNPSKSLDFRWWTGNTTCYASHKYTLEGGGNQDSQYKEMLALLQKFHGCHDTSCILIVIVDGRYFTQKKMLELQHKTRTHGPKSFAVHIEDVPTILKEYA